MLWPSDIAVRLRNIATSTTTQRRRDLLGTAGLRNDPRPGSNAVGGCAVGAVAGKAFHSADRGSCVQLARPAHKAGRSQ